MTFSRRRALWGPLALTLLTLGWGAVARARLETWWWVSALDLVPPQVGAPLPL